MSKSMTLPDFLTEDQINAAIAIYRKHKDTGRCATEICKQIIEPNMAAIQIKLGQQCDAKYLAYCCEHVFNETKV